jgi:hypothetical protein
MTRLVVLLLGVTLSACATHPPPPLPQPTPEPLTISETLSDAASICVLQDPFHDPRYVCISVGHLRRLIRGRVVARLEAAP